MMAELNAIINKSIELKNIISQTQNGLAGAQYIYNIMTIKCQFFAVPGDSPALLRMPDIEMLNMSYV